MKLLQAFLIALACGLSLAATNTELEVKTYVAKASDRFYNLYDKITAEIFSIDDDDDMNTALNKLSTIKEIAKELVEISEEAGEFDQNQINDPQLKRALTNLREVGSLFVLGDDYFESIAVALMALQSLVSDKDIEPYMGGINMPNQDDSPIAYYPDIQKVFETSTDAEELKYYWEAFREKNTVWASVNFYTIIEAMQKAATILDRPVLDLYYSNYDTEKFLKEMDRVMEELKPTYQQLHAFIRNELYKKYGDDVVDPYGPIPDHLFEQVLSQAWKEGSVIETYFPFKELPYYDGFVKDFTSRQMLNTAQEFYKSLGFSDLDEDFLQNRLKEQDESESTNGCRATIVDNTPKVFMEYCQKVEFKKFMQMHGYVGRIQYAQEKKNLPSYFFNAYDLEYPVGEAVILSASSPKHLQAIGLAKDSDFSEKALMNRLFRMGIHTILNIPVFYVHSKIVNELLNGTIDMESVNKRYWKLMEDYAGVEPPSDREEGSIDFPYTFYFEVEENHQTKKFVSEILGYQFYKALCQKSGQTGQLHNCDFYGNKDVGNVVKSMMTLGSTKPWKEVISKILTEKPNLCAEPLMEYYTPIVDWLKTINKQNKVKIGWNESRHKVL
ncbi:angiotensin-converting enzyme [Musca domestica]|uniref:Angiotensin-converting enzyme n=1 Tax=Musca domestica TaxID=7370 RepID=T1PF78_MUSDO|nr:angiotensin-converting enzyme [Musca domestica]